jgi:hypothetical protein
MTPLAWIRVGGYAVLAALIAWGIHSWDAKIRETEDAKIEAQDQRALAEAAKRRAAQMAADAATNRGAVDELSAAKKRLAALESHPGPELRVCKPAAPADRGAADAARVASSGTREGATAGGTGDGVRGGDQTGVDIWPGVQLIASVAEELAAQNRALLRREHGLETQGPEAAAAAAPPR